MRVDIQNLERRLKSVLEHFGLQNFMHGTFELADKHKIVARLAYESEVDKLELISRDFRTTVDRLFGDLIHDIENSPHIASIKARHADEVSVLHDQIKTLQEQNMKLSGTIEYLDSKLAANFSQMKQK